MLLSCNTPLPCSVSIICWLRFDSNCQQIESSVDLPHHVIFGNSIAKTKLVEQLTFGHSSDGPSRIDLAENRVTTTESRFAASLNRLLQQNRHITGV